MPISNQAFDLNQAIREAGLPPEVVQRVVETARGEFPHDDLMYELHVIRGLETELLERLGWEAWSRRLRERIAANSG